MKKQNRNNRKLTVFMKLKLKAKKDAAQNENETNNGIRFPFRYSRNNETNNEFRCLFNNEIRYFVISNNE